MFLAAVTDNIKLTGILIDAVVIVLTIIVALICSKVGFLKIFKGLLAAVLTIILAVMLINPIHTVLKDSTQWESDLSNSLATPLGSALKIDSSFTLRYIPEEAATEGSPVGIVFTEGSTVISIDDLESDGNLFDFRKTAIKHLVLPQAEKYFDDTPEGTVNVLKTLADNVSYIIMIVGIFIVLAIILRIVIGIILAIMKKLIARFYLIHFVDHLIGFVAGIAFVIGFVYVILGVLKAFDGRSFMDQIKTGIESTSLVKYLYNENLLTPIIQGFVDKIFEKK
ncbi:MAG: hypothetical protein LBF68_01440 [Christensenellaceae bacterium]|jgi:uncharacterized membrane protein required for colicin V production|nr:hypothetical protein [Christensenellaceae bacterium]